MANRNQSFTQRQHMVRSSFEIYRYCDAKPGEISLHHHEMCIRDRCDGRTARAGICGLHDVWHL